MNFTKTLKVLAVTASFVSTALVSPAQAAGSASYSVTPSSTQNNGATFTVSVYENSGAEAVNGVQADLSYNTASLEFVSASTGAFTTCPVAPKGGAGKVSIECALLGGSVTGNQLVASITFKALAGSGSTMVSMLPSSKIVSATTNQDIWNQQLSGATVNFATPAPAPSPTPAPATPVAKPAVKTTTPVVNGASTSTPAQAPAVETPAATTTTKTEETPVITEKVVLPSANESEKSESKAGWYVLGAVAGVLVAGAIVARKQIAKAVASAKAKMANKTAAKAVVPAAVAVKTTKKAVAKAPAKKKAAAKKLVAKKTAAKTTKKTKK